MEESKYYSKEFYSEYGGGSYESAREIVPIIMKLIKPKSVVDVGCGVGAWLNVFKEYDVDIFGVDGEWVDKNLLRIPEEKFSSVDLKKPLNLNRNFDLVVSLEVAEHIPGNLAETFIESLTSLGPVVLFSAAIPFQCGSNHINEQWPEYWVELFEKRNYIVIDCIRKEIWNSETIEPWYQQNMLIFVDENHLENNNTLKEMFKQTNKSQLSVVHPKIYMSKAKAFKCGKKSIRHILGGIWGRLTN